MKIIVTGASGHLAAAVLPALCERPDVTAVTGLDVAAPRYAHAKFRPVRCDIRSEEALRQLSGHDALVHLAFVVLRGRMALAEMVDINVRAGHALLLAARRAGVRRLVHMSSAAVYGRGGLLTEDAPLDPLPGFAYAEHKAQLELLLARDLPDCVRLRPHVVLGAHEQALLRWLLRQPCYVRLPEPQPRLQCVHEDDVARAVVLALSRDATGAYNLASADDFSFRDAIRSAHRVSFALPLSVARVALTAAWRFTGRGGEPAWIAGLGASLTLDCSRAQRQLGWQPTVSAAALLRGAPVARTSRPTSA